MTIDIPASCRDRPVSAAGREPPDPLAILSSVGEAVYDWDLLTDALHWSPNAATLLGLDDMAALETGSGFHALTAGSSLFSRRDAICDGGRSDSGGGVPYHIRYAVMADDAGRRIVWVDDTGRWFAGSDGRPAQAHGVVRIAPVRGTRDTGTDAPEDVDAPTRCWSRTRLLRVLDARLGAGWSKAGFALLLIGIEDLVPLNRRYGYDAVDEMLMGIAVSLRGQIRGADCLARYSGNKFALLLNHCDETQIAPAAERALEILSVLRPETSAGVIPVRARVGGVLAPRHGRTVHALLLNAETALEAAPGASFALFDPAAVAQDDRVRADDMAAEIVAALNGGRVRLALQPIVAARSGECLMSEALLRIVLPDGHVLEPSTILPAAARAGLTPLLDHRILDLAVAHLRDHSGAVSLNIAGETLRDPDWPARVAAASRLNPGVASRLVFELSEAAVIEDLAASIAALGALTALGVRIAIDRFGAGHASLRALRQLRPHFLKIDGAFVQNIARSPDDRFLVRCLLAVARQIGAPAIAEWVENAGTAATLTEWGAAYLQGAYFGSAEMPEDGANTRDAARAGRREAWTNLAGEPARVGKGAGTA